MYHKPPKTGWAQVKCPVCGESFSSRGIKGHVRWVHGLGELSPELPKAPPKPAARNPVDKSAEAVPPKVFKVPKAKVLPPEGGELVVEAAGEKKADEKKPPALEPGARSSGEKGLLDWDNFFAREVADGFKVIDDAFPGEKKKKGSESPWVAFAWALGSVTLMVYFGRRKEKELAAAAATAAAPAAPSSAAATVGSVDSGMGGPWDEEGD